MAANSYNGTLTISGSTFTPDNKAIAVTLDVTTQPIAQSSSTSLSFNIAQGAQMLADMAFNRLRTETRKRRSNPFLKTDIPSRLARRYGSDVRSGEVW